MASAGERHRKRCRRHDIEGHAHYLTFSCLRRQPFLSRPRACRWLATALHDGRAKHGFHLWGYVFMPEHVHLLLLPREGSRISDILSSIKVSVSRKAVGWTKQNAPWFLPRMARRHADGRTTHHFWQAGGGYDRNIWSLLELFEKIDYIHANPVRRGLVEGPEDWRWSSWSALETGRTGDVPVDTASLPIRSK